MPEDFFPDAVPCPHERKSVSGRYCIDCFEELDPHPVPDEIMQRLADD